MRINFAGELLHFSKPHKYWLWTNWIWDPDANTGSLPLVIQEEVDLLGDTPGETYLRVGQAMAQVRQAGQQRGFSNLGQGTFGVDVFRPVFTRFTCTRFFESNYPMNLIESSPTYLS